MNKKVLSFDRIILVVTGVVVAVSAFILTLFGNPKNMGFCIACFVRDTAGALKFHSAGAVQYVRPEIIGLILGSFIMSVSRKEFRSRSGSSPMLRLTLGAFVAMTALVFLGCPLRMIIRLAGGDLNALVGLVGFTLGIFVGTLFLNKGFSLGAATRKMNLEGLMAPITQIVMLILVVAVPSLFAFSESGPGSMRAPLILALIIGLIIGALCQLSRFCTAGSIRDLFLTKDFTLFLGPVTVFIVLTILNLATGNYKFGFVGQPIAHTEWLWNLLSMFAVGHASTLLGGCPLRQLILAGEGNADSFITAIGMFIGAALSHNFGLASSASGTTVGGRVVTIVAICFVALVSVLVTKKRRA